MKTLQNRALRCSDSDILASTCNMKARLDDGKKFVSAKFPGLELIAHGDHCLLTSAILSI